MKVRSSIDRERKKLKKKKEKKEKILDNAHKSMSAQDIINESTPNPEEYYSKDNKWPDQEKYQLVSYTTQKIAEDLLTPEQKEVLERQRKQDEFIENYFKNHNIKDQAHLNYAIEHDEKFRMFLEKAGRLEQLYTGKYLSEIKEQEEMIEQELTEEATKDKRKKIAKKFSAKNITNTFKDSKKELDLTPYKNKKKEAQGFILCLYLRKNGLMDLRYVRMDEVGQIKVDGYVYHERDANYRFGKKNDPVLLIMEGALVPINKETLKENLGFEAAEAQKLVIKGIEQAEVVKAAGVDDNAKKPFTPNKWVIGVILLIIVGVYAYLGGFS